MPDTPRRNRASRQSEKEQFRPHERYPNLNANAGLGEAPRHRPRPRPAAPKRQPQAHIRLDSSVAAPRLRTQPGAMSAQLRNGRVVSLLGLLAVIGLGYWLLTGAGFRISKVEVKGSRFLNSAEVIRLTGVDKENVFLLDEASVAQKVRALPYVLESKVSKQFPDGMQVEVVERKSVLNWKVGSLNYLVDAEGVVLESLADQQLNQEAKKFTVIQSLDDRKLKSGDRVDAVAIRSAQTIQSQLASSGFKLSAVQYSPTAGLIVVSAPESGNWKALLGTDAQLDQKINLLKGLLSDKNIKWSYADLRFVNKPAIQ